MSSKLQDKFKRVVPFDLETSDGRGRGSLDPWTGKIALMQLQYDGETYLLRPTRENLARVKAILENPENLIVGHNLRFDYLWMLHQGIFIHNPFDTMVASEVLYAGYTRPDEATKRIIKVKSHFDDVDIEPLFADFDQIIQYQVKKKNRFSHGFNVVLLRELGVYISKEMQNSDWAKEPLTEAQKQYAINDVIYSIDLAEHLYSKLAERGLEDTFWLEMEAFPVLAHMETVGLGIDEAAWRKFALDKREAVAALKKHIEHRLGLRLAESDPNQQGLFGLVPVKVNINSNDQMTEIFTLPDFQKDTIEEHMDEDPFLVDIFEYKAEAKLASTYGLTYLKHVKEDGRLRGRFSQTRTATGRLSSFAPNMQNIPSKYLKSMIRAAPGFIPVAGDFSQVELRILAYASGDEEFIQSCNAKDMHTANARLIYKVDSATPITKSQRSRAKVVSFSIPYGTSPNGLFARGITDTIEEAKELIERFYDSFPKVAAYLRQNAASAATYGYTSDPFGRIRNYHLPDRPKDFDRKWENFKTLRGVLYDANVDFRGLMEYPTIAKAIAAEKRIKDPESGELTYIRKFPDIENFLGTSKKAETQYAELREIYSWHRQLNAVRREGQNHPIQAASADITKRALADVYRFLKEVGHGLITLSVHDSIFYEMRLGWAEWLAPNVRRVMEEAGPKIIPDIVTPVDMDFGYMEAHDCTSCQETVYEFNHVMEEDGSIHPRDWESILCEGCEAEALQKAGAAA